MKPISAACDSTWPAFRESGTRSKESVIWIVLHSTEGGTAASVARYFASRQATGSAHLVVDDDECFRCLRNDQVPWAAAGANHAGFHIEQCGFARWSAVIWRSHLQTLQRAAYKTALHCSVFDVPTVYRLAAELKAGFPGITTHAECTKAFGGTHTDPGLLWPRRLFMTYVRRYFADLTDGV